MGAKFVDAVVSAVHSIGDYQQHGQFSSLSQSFRQPDASLGAIMLSASIVLADFIVEYFNDFSLQVRQKGIFKQFFLMSMSMSNGHLGYVPTQKTTGKAHVEYALKSIDEMFITKD